MAGSIPGVHSHRNGTGQPETLVSPWFLRLWGPEGAVGPTAGGCPNWMTLQEGQAGALSSPLQLPTNTSAMAGSRG